MKPTKEDLKEAVNWLSTKAYEKEDVPILLAEYKRYLIFRVFKFLMFLIVLWIPFALVTFFVESTESGNIYIGSYKFFITFSGIVLGLGYGNGIYAIFYNHSLLRKQLNKN